MLRRAFEVGLLCRAIGYGICDLGLLGWFALGFVFIHAGRTVERSQGDLFVGRGADDCRLVFDGLYSGAAFLVQMAAFIFS